ncbi:hypothetical protein ABIC88_003137 [Pseudomonas kilonensis]
MVFHKEEKEERGAELFFSAALFSTLLVLFPTIISTSRQPEGS